MTSENIADSLFKRGTFLARIHELVARYAQPGTTPATRRGIAVEMAQLGWSVTRDANGLSFTGSVPIEETKPLPSFPDGGFGGYSRSVFTIDGMPTLGRDIARVIFEDNAARLAKPARYVPVFPLEDWKAIQTALFPAYDKARSMATVEPFGQERLARVEKLYRAVGYVVDKMTAEAKQAA